ncbi:MAG: hypothetical protein ABIP71_11510, partial [Verrucomicrobiota bacterium]
KILDIPPVEKIERALLSVKGFTRVDAHTFANDAYGILVKNISAEQASAFSQALLGQRIETDVVAQADLPTLPPTKFVQRLDCTPEGLLIYDPLGRSFPLPWPHVMLMAAGCVRVTDFTRVEKPSFSTSDSEGGTYETTSISSVEERNDRLLLEIVVSGAVLRYSVSAEKFRFDYLGERRTKSLPENFALLVQDLAAFAPQAMLNRGAFFLKQNENLFPYPSKNAFFEEIIWLLWKMKTDGRF